MQKDDEAHIRNSEIINVNLPVTLAIQIYPYNTRLTSVASVCLCGGWENSEKRVEVEWKRTR